ncbi:hypothetical protein AJ79_04646 [Helicocarpus griseus UAMH5409]|uniref:Inner kinetochore subunit AME1 domain-containing protein n=1 Tax=Helicocarpus griseus UAMH5409 TaxID=1447875 RepID=A0A2B7XSB1_9EURO|nr:hypothetical protein AJ79_04646 [Helicocarpus griseus UAMH5409]
MASNREERRLMRQRGAGNRATKEIDFGFGFAFGAPKVQPPTAPAPTAQPELNVPPAQTTSSRKTPTPDKRRLNSPRLSRRTPPGSQNASSSRRNTPRSGGSQRGPRPSVFDIPSDDAPEQGRENKRRRIVPFGSFAEDAALTSESIRNNEVITAEDSTRPLPDAQPGLDVIGKYFAPREPEIEPHAAPIELDRGEDESHPSLKGQPEVQGQESADVTFNRLQEESQSQSPKQSSQRKRRKRKSVVQGPKKQKKPPAVANQSTLGPQPEPEDEPEGEPDIESEPEHEDERELEPESEPEPGLEAEPEHHPENEPAQESEPEEQEVENTEEHTGQTVKQTRRKSKKRKSIAQVPPRHKRRVPRLSDESQEQQAEEQHPGAEDAEDGNAEGENEDEQEHSGPSQQATRSKRKPRRARKAPSRQPQQRQSQPKQPEEEEEEAESENPEPVSSQPQPPQRKQRRQRPAEQQTTEPQPQQQPDEEADNAEEGQQQQQPQRTQRQRQPRGETVPVLIHRFANPSALHNLTEADVAEAPTNDPTQPTSHKHPARTGVNPADVLSQICHETLEKTLSTLETGISRESNSARRAEWTRKRKAVELFGAELEQRLFEISEVLEGNFVLHAQLKREKREVAALRARLMEVRRERGAVEERIEEVRRRFGEEEGERREHDTLNNSLHDLQLAIDRGRRVDDGDEQNASANPAVGLEFMLRAVAQDVSSSAPGAQGGGLLDRVRRFNEQLERAAELLG